MTFPKRLFQTWKSHTIIPHNFQYWSQTWKSHNPEYEYTMWDDTENRAFIEKNFPWFLETFDGYPQNIQRADAVRYFFLYVYGGVYADMDFECLKPLDSLLHTHSDATVILGKMSATKTGWEPTHTIPNALMISQPRDEFWIYVFQQLLRNRGIANVEKSTGPGMLYAAIYAFNNKIKYSAGRVTLYDTIIRSLDSKPIMATKLAIVDPCYLYPLSWVDNDTDRIVCLNTEDYTALTQDSRAKYPHAYAVTYWAHSW